MFNVVGKYRKKEAKYFKAKTGMGAKVMSGISSYILLVGGKLAAMGVIALLFGDLVTFSGAISWRN